MSSTTVDGALLEFLEDKYPPGHRRRAQNEGICNRLRAEIGSWRMVDVTDTLIHDILVSRTKNARATGARMSPSTLNRTVTEYLSRVFLHQEKKHGIAVSFPKKPKFKNHRLREPRQRERWLSDEEYAKLKDGADPNYMRVVDFALMTGLRLENLLPTWDKIDLSAKTLRVIVKGGDEMTFDLPDAAIRLIETAPHAHPPTASMRVFYWEKANGDRHPITREGFKSWWRRRMAVTGLKNLHIHDLRHTAATALLETTGDITLVQRQLGHQNISTTMRYAHAKRTKLVRGLNATAAANPWGGNGKKDELDQGGASALGSSNTRPASETGRASETRGAGHGR